MSKKRTIPTIIVFLSLGIVCAMLIFHVLIRKDVENIDYDIKVYKKSYIVPTGYASSNEYYLINKKNKRIYKISDFYIFGDSDESKNKHNYKVQKGKISESNINTLINYVEESYNKDASAVYGWTIEYKEKKITIPDEEFDDSLLNVSL